jgi:uncharacterized YigZ family protein
MLFEETYLTLDSPSTGEFRDRGSRFSGFAYPVKSETEVKQLINSIKSEHPKANHHCYAFRLGPGKTAFRFSDDREPAGSAGKPIFGVIQSKDLTDILIIVVRYFGGTLLGVPGLINAYRSAAQMAVENGKTVQKTVVERYQIRFAYEFLNLIMEMVKISKASILQQKLEMDCAITIELPKQAADDLISKIRNHYKLKGNCEIIVV